MKHIHHSLFILLVAVFALTVSCKKATFVNVTPDTIEVSEQGGSGVVKVETDGGSISITHQPEWAEVDVKDLNVWYNIAGNTTHATREDMIVLDCGGLTKSIVVRQLAKATYIKVDQEKVSIGKEGGTVTINIDTDGDVQSQVEGDLTAEVSGRKITVTAPENTGSARSAKVTLSAEGVEPVVVKIEQAGNVCATCNGAGIINCRKCGGKGWHDPTDPTSNSMMDGCTACGGSGFCTEGSEWDYVQGKGKTTCPTCGGSGR